MKDIYIIHGKYYDFENQSITIGGVQTYISDLMKICKGICSNIVVVQMGNSDNRIDFDNFIVIQYHASNLKELERKVESKLASEINHNESLVLFASDTLIFPHLKFRNAIAIQHGINWDIPMESNKKLGRALVGRFLQAYKLIKLQSNVKELICVDYNYVNWYRALVKSNRMNMKIIPNYTQIAEENEKSNARVEIIFARRFYEYRGTRIFTQAIKKILEEKEEVYVTVAGSGPDEAWMRRQLEGYEHVVFTQYESQESLAIHANKHIAVVPTVGSEGTSLSLLEAMSAQCAVICTDVGGMTNIVLNDYNGLMIGSGDVEQLYEAIKELVEHPEKRTKLAARGYETVKETFAYERWERQWRTVIKGALYEK